ncbi:MAG TPA: hypothetical protein VHV57_04965 [Acidimicrobiales bacterium]|nr:hypothetical protein [Acidimicrobiales bacterium]
MGAIEGASRGLLVRWRREKVQHRVRRRVTIVLAGSLAGLGVISVNLNGTNARAVAASTFTYGEGNAQAQSLDMDIEDSGANINVFAGQTTASYQDAEANAASSNVNIPLSSLLGSLQICSQPPPNLPLPTPLDVNTGANGNTAPASASDATANGLDGSRLVQATPGSHAVGQDSLSGLALPGVVQVSGAKSEAKIDADTTSMSRIATATSDISSVSLLNGLVQLRGMQWQLQQSATGPDNQSDHRTSSASFSLGSITVGALTIPVPSSSDIPRAIATANGLLAPLGVTLRLPAQSSTTNGEALSPLTVAVGGNKDLWGPVIAKLLGNATFNQLQKSVTGTLFDPVSCNELNGLLKDTGELNLYVNFLGAAAPLVIGIFGQALGGSGEIDFEVGGVSTTLDDTYYAPVSFGAPSSGLPQSLVPAFPPASTGVVGAPTLPTTTAPGKPALSAPATRSAGAVVTKCESTSPADRPMCWVGRAPLGAALTGVGVIAVLAADEVFLRRRTRRRVGEESMA